MTPRQRRVGEALLTLAGIVAGLALIGLVYLAISIF